MSHGCPECRERKDCRDENCRPLHGRNPTAASGGSSAQTTNFMAVGELCVYTDASLPDAPKVQPGKPPPPRRPSRAYVAWLGYDHELAHDANPCFAGEAYVGIQGSQRAEMIAAIYGLTAAIAYTLPREGSKRPFSIVLRTDNHEVERQLNGRANADVLVRLRKTALSLVQVIKRERIIFTVELASEKTDPMMRAVHGRSREAVRVTTRKNGWPGKPPLYIPF